ncbi:hypothetical protein [Sphingobacterium multivorum]|uniref:hypothetical protein n=1 Tax=Sphingobacterium multivorum TaxID=28454 RepID=UPI0036B24C5C
MEKSELLLRIEALEKHLGFYTEPLSLEVGKWYKNTKVEGTFINCQVFTDNVKSGYGVHMGLWSDHWGILNFEDYNEASSIEIRDMLFSEAKRRYNVDDIPIYLDQPLNSIPLKGYLFEYINNNVCASSAGIQILYSEGKWAEISKLPKVGDVCKFWDEDSSFVIGKLASIHMYCLGDNQSYPFMLENGAEYKHAQTIDKLETLQLLFGKEEPNE